MARKPVILCVDDASSVLEGREMLIEENGYKVLSAAREKDAVQALVSNTVDLVLVDDHMNGDVAAIHLRACKPDVPIVLLSGEGRLPPGALEAFDAFISKSAPITSLLEKVDYLLSLRFLFQPLDDSWADDVGAQHKH